MFDFPFQEPSVLTALFSIISYLFFISIGRIKYVGTNQYYINRKFQAEVLLLIYVLIAAHSINGDFFHLMKSVHNYQFTIGAYHSQEDVYPLIAKIVNRNYLLFRLIVWGIGFYCTLKVFKNEDINQHFAIWWLLVCYSILFTYARAAVAAAVFFWGLTLLLNDKKVWFKRLIGIGIVILSFQFHRSLLVLLLLTPIVFVPLNRRLFYIILFSMPVIIIVVRIVFSNALGEIAMLDDEVLQRKLENYSAAEQRTQTLRNTILNLIKYTSIYLPFIISCYFIVVKKYYNKLSNNCRKLFNFTYWLYVVTTSVSYLNIETNIFFYRMLYMSIIPTTAIFCYLIKEHVIKNMWSKRVMYLCIISQMLHYAYMLYLNLH